MDFDEDGFGMDRRGGDHLKRQSSAISASICNVDVCQGNQMDSSPYPSNSMVGSFSAGLWNQPTPSQGSRFREASTPSSSNGDPAQKPVSIPLRLDTRAGFSQAGPGFRPPGFCHFPSDPAFVERAAMLSCFDGGFSGPEIPLRTPSSDSSSKGVQVQSNKRKRNTHAQLEMELDHVEGAQQSSAKQKTKKSSEKEAKDVLDATNEDYVHVRARRGQATNSHSLAERVRREKISERMKFLQELVPGCSKITGKAVMLDEIINYVQSLQRQVEFLSMKLAAVNPRIDFNLETLLSKDFLQPQGGPSSIGFLPEMTHPQLHLPQQGFIQSGVPGITHPLEALRRAMSAQLTIMSGYKESTPQMPDTWNDELQNVIQMNFGASGPSLNTEELSEKPRDGFPI